MNLNLERKIESLLFWKGEPTTISELSKMLSVPEEEIEKSLNILEDKIKEQDRGIILVKEGDKVLLTTHPDVSELISRLNREELTKDLSKATLETLSIILYRGPIRRSTIDYIRGVNSQFILRTLSIRGLIEKKTDPKDERAYIYAPSLELLQFLGVSKKENLPDFEKVNQDIQNFMETEEKVEEKIEDNDNMNDNSSNNDSN
jgi:segregation and condensation protein B